MNKKLVELIREEFEKLISVKNSWGKNEVSKVLEQAISNATLRIIDES